MDHLIRSRRALREYARRHLTGPVELRVRRGIRTHDVMGLFPEFGMSRFAGITNGEIEEHASMDLWDRGLAYDEAIIHLDDMRTWPEPVGYS